MYTLHAIGVTTDRNTGVNTDQPAYTQLKSLHMRNQRGHKHILRVAESLFREMRFIPPSQVGTAKEEAARQYERSMRISPDNQWRSAADEADMNSGGQHTGVITRLATSQPTKSLADGRHFGNCFAV